MIFKVFGGGGGGDGENGSTSHKAAPTEGPGHEKNPVHRQHDWKDEDSNESVASETDEANKIHFSGDFDHAHRPFFINSNNVNNISGSKPTKKTSEWFLNFLKNWILY